MVRVAALALAHRDTFVFVSTHVLWRVVSVVLETEIRKNVQMCPWQWHAPLDHAQSSPLSRLALSITAHDSDAVARLGPSRRLPQVELEALRVKGLVDLAREARCLELVPARNVRMIWA